MLINILIGLVVIIVVLVVVIATRPADPCLDYGAIVEVRPVAGECPTFQRVKDLMARATA